MGQPGGTDPGSLAADQQDLRNRLDQIIQGLGRNGVEVPEGLNDAGQAMGQARDDLANSQFGSAGQNEQRALDQLRDSAQQMARDMMAQNGQQQGEGEQARGDQLDPLGRPIEEQGSMAGGTVRIPDQSDLARAREILEELRRRAGEANRAQQELDYIDRLLKQF
jgi:DNA anti-recombination protein RmuC